MRRGGGDPGPAANVVVLRSGFFVICSAESAFHRLFLTSVLALDSKSRMRGWLLSIGSGLTEFGRQLHDIRFVGFSPIAPR